MTQSLTKAWETCQYRRDKQIAYNEKHGITPRSVIRPVQESLRVKKEEEEDNLAVAEDVSSKDAKKLAKQLEKEMIEAVKKLEFEKAALLRDQISFLRGEGGEKSLQSQAVGGYKKTKYGKRRKFRSKK
jgi:excinuclease ABC subunit B